MRRDAVLEVGGYDESLRAQRAEGCEDWKLALLIAERHPFAVVPLALTGYRQLRCSMSTNVDPMLRSYVIVIGEMRARHPQLPAWLFIRSRSKMTAWLAYRAWYADKALTTTRMFAISISHDPRMIASIAAQAGSIIGRQIRQRLLDTKKPMQLVDFDPEKLPPPHLRRRPSWSRQRPPRFDDTLAMSPEDRQER